MLFHQICNALANKNGLGLLISNVFPVGDNGLVASVKQQANNSKDEGAHISLLLAGGHVPYRAVTMFSRLLAIFHRQQSPDMGGVLYSQLIEPKRLAIMVQACRQKDSFTGRFETLALAAALSLRGQPPEVARGLVKALVADIDMSFRERSLGDASVKKHATNHAAAFYGRLKAYGQALDEETLCRNLFADHPTAEQEAAIPKLINDLEKALSCKVDNPAKIIFS